MASHALYRFYSATGQLLYVGITNNPGYRFQQHQQDKPWWHEVSGISMERYNTREEVLRAESRAISVECPKYNIRRPKLRAEARAEARRGHDGARRLVWTCRACGRPIADGEGYIHVDEEEKRRHESARLEFDHRAEIRRAEGVLFARLSDYLSLPEPARWEAHHGDCDPKPDADDYWFDVARARTHAQLLNWTAHLMGKVWLEDTDWDDFIRRALRVDA